MSVEKELQLANNIGKLLKDLEIVAVNLNIEAAHIQEKNDIKPIADRLRSIIIRVEDDVHTLINDIEKDEDPSAEMNGGGDL